MSDDFDERINYSAVLKDPTFLANCLPASLERYREECRDDEEYCDWNEMAMDLQSEGVELLSVGWDAGHGGCKRVLEWNGLYFITTTDYGWRGPYKTFMEAEADWVFDGGISGTIHMDCSEFTDEELKERALRMLGEDEIIVLNGVCFINRDSQLVVATKEEIEERRVNVEVDDDSDDSDDSDEGKAGG